MNDTITISFEEVSNSSTQIKNCSQKLSTIMEDLNRVINDINSGWDSSASQTFKERFQGFVNKFNDCKASIDAYAKFLDQTVDAYRNLDTKISSAAQE